jgi:hypothetical protein
VADDRPTEASDAPPPRRPSGDADTMPAAERDKRPTIPDIAPTYDARYRLGAELGRGGMGRVVEAFDTQLGRAVALKEVLPRAGQSVDRRFQREVQITARLEHASIVPLYDAGTMPDGRPFYVMRRVSGRPLDELIGRAKDLPERMALLPNLLAAMDAVAHAHRRGIIHRDLKPANILVGELGETVVIDWGLAKVVGEEDPDDKPGAPVKIPEAADSLQTQVGSVFGTPGFMAPEQARGDELGPRGDVFALGASLYQLLAGRPPIGGNSATEAIESSMKRRITPVVIAAPGAPAELVAIVEKALAFDPEDRYANAGLLGEDVRRFLTGQVVAAHEYTRRERIARFAKKHRAPLSVAALALVALAVLAWIGVHRIVVERDIAQNAFDEAEAQRKQALAANAQLLERTDSLLVTKAGALVDSNPTEALALLKELRPTSAKLADARAIASAAVSRGAAWGLRADGVPRFIAVDTNVTKLAEVTTDNTLHVWDLDTRRVLFERVYAPHARPVWVENGRLLMLRQRGETPELFDPKTGLAERLTALPSLQEATATAKGDRVLGADDHGHAFFVTIASHAVTPVWPEHEVRSFSIAPDGSFAVLADGKSCVVIDATGTELAHRDGDIIVEDIVDRRAIVFDSGAKPQKVFEVVLANGTAAWTELAVELAPKTFLIAAHYRGTLLSVMTTGGTFAFRDGKLAFKAPLDSFDAFALFDAADGVAVTPARDGTLHFVSDSADGKIGLPVAMANVHLAGRRGRTRFVAAATGLVLVYDLADVLPTSIPKRGLFQAAFADDDTLLMWPDDDRYMWRDIATGKTTGIDHPMRVGARVFGVDPAAGRLLVAEAVTDGEELSLFTKGSPKVKLVAHGKRLVGRLVADGVMFALNDDPRVLVSLHDETPRELAKVDGGVQSLQPLGPHRFAALGRRGELVRGTVSGGNVERVHVDVDGRAFLGTDLDNNVIVAVGSKLIRWGSDVRQLVQLPRAVDALQACSGGVLAALDDNSIVYVETGAKAVVHTVVGASGTPATIGGDGTWAAFAGNGGQINVVELPSLARWTLPIHYVPQNVFLIAAPTKRRFIQGASLRLEVRDLPQAPADLTAWIEDHTNAFESTDNVLTWPWQRP